MNANPRIHRRTLFAAAAGIMMLAGVSHAAERGNARPSAATAGSASIPQAEVQYGDRRLPSRTRLSIAHQGDDGIPPYGRAADPAAASSDRGNASLPQAEVQYGDRRLPSRTRLSIAHQGDDGIPPYGRAADPTAASSDRGNAILPQAVIWSSAELSGPCTAVVEDRHHDSFPEAEIFEAFLLDLIDPFRCGTKSAGHSGWDMSDEALAALITCDPMDLDVDGDVDFDDFKLLTTAFGTDEGDLNGDGIVDGADLGLMLARMTLSIETAD